jgi:hypothetical protein
MRVGTPTRKHPKVSLLWACASASASLSLIKGR